MKDRDCFRHNLITSTWSLSPFFLCLFPFIPHSHYSCRSSSPFIVFASSIPEVFAKILMVSYWFWKGSTLISKLQFKFLLESSEGFDWSGLNLIPLVMSGGGSFSKASKMKSVCCVCVRAHRRIPKIKLKASTESQGPPSLTSNLRTLISNFFT